MTAAAAAIPAACRSARWEPVMIRAPRLGGAMVIAPPATAITASPAASHGRGSRSRSHWPAGAATTAPAKVISEIVAPSANGDSPNACPTWAETGPTLPRAAAARTPAAIVLAGRTHSRPGTAPPWRRR